MIKVISKEKFYDVFIYKTVKGDIWVKSVDEGVIEIFGIDGFRIQTVEDYAHIVSQCFDSESDFIQTVMSDFNQVNFEGIKFRNKKIHVLVTRANSSYTEIMNQYNKRYKELFE